MKAVHVIEGRGVPLDRSDVDTDQIIPSDWLKRVERSGYGRGLFAEWRDDTKFVLNDQQYHGASILISRHRFGTGSSREHAVWALQDYGFRAVVASSFGDIFKNNSVKQGLVTVILDESTLDQLFDIVTTSPETVLTIDVDLCVMEAAAFGWRATFSLDDDTRERLLHGLDDIDLTMRHEGDLDDFERVHDQTTPSLTGLFDAQGHVVGSNG